MIYGLQGKNWNQILGGL